MKYFLIVIFVIGIVFKQFSQTVTPSVINAAGGGGQVGSSNMEVYYNIGEPIITTASNNNNIITQGFLQSDIVGEFGLTASAYITPNSCLDKADGTISVSANVSGAANQSDFQISYYWHPSGYCQSQNSCASVNNLPAGTYSVMVVSQYIGSGTSVPNDTVKITNLSVNGSSEPCQINVYNGITPNGDGQNDFFAIDNIENFPDNRVEIYNRWGQKLAGFDNYNNTTNNWKGTINNSEQLAPSGTYFYIIDLKNGSKPVKGWIELTTNK